MNINTIKYSDTSLVRERQEEQENNTIGSSKQGDIIEGVVVNVSDQVSINFSGREVKFSNNAVPNATEGEVRSFEIKEVSNQSIVLKEVRREQNDVKAKVITFTKVDASSDFTIKNNKKEVSTAKNQLLELCTKITKEDYKELKQEQSSFEEYDSKRLERVLERIKAGKELRQTSIDSQVEDLKKGREQAKDIGRSQTVKNSVDSYIADALVNANMPVTKENIDSIKVAMEQISMVSNMNDGSYAYIIQNELEVTPNTIYKSAYSSINQGAAINETLWEELKPSIVNLLSKDDIEVSEESLSDAKWLLSNGLLVNGENIQKKQLLDQLKKGVTDPNMITQFVNTLKNGINPNLTNLLNNGYEKIVATLTDLKHISDDAIKVAVYRQRMQYEMHDNSQANNKEEQEAVSIESLRQAMQQGQETVTVALQNVSSEDINVITAKRQIEEIRLKLTLESGQKLLSKGIRLDTDHLSRIVEGLKEIEQDYYKQVMSEVGGKESAADLLKESLTTINQLKGLPNAALGRTLRNKNWVTLPELQEEGMIQKEKYAKAGQAYETLMTSPRKDMGDSIHKAFQNVDTILEELGLEATSYNERAVRILAYNQMEISRETIQDMKQYDAQVDELFKNMQPVVTATLIKDGINPLTVSIQELNEKASKILDEIGQKPEEKFSEYLLKLENKKDITDDQRSAYIGVYRLLHQVEKSDGAVIGSVVKAGKEITLSNLLTEVRTKNHGMMDTSIDDSFGVLLNRLDKGSKIDEQINAAYGSGQEGMRFYDHMLKDSIASITPEGVQEVVNHINTYGDISLESLQEKLSSSAEQNENALNEQEIKNLQELSKNSKNEIAFLNDYNLVDSISNIQATNLLLNDENYLYKSIQTIANDMKIDMEEYLKLDQFLDGMDYKEKMNQTVESYCDKTKDFMNNIFSLPAIEQTDITMLKNSSKIIGLTKQLSNREYYNVPFVFEDTVTNINLTILHNEKEKGTVTITFRDKNNEKISLDYSISDQDVKCFVTCEGEQSKQRMTSLRDEISKVTEQSGLKLSSIYFDKKSKTSEAYVYKNDGIDKEKAWNENSYTDSNVDFNSEVERAENNSNVKTDVLYQLSKLTIMMLTKNIYA